MTAWNWLMTGASSRGKMPHPAMVCGVRHPLPGADCVRG
jgi:hypothetical protein